jgi:hypothetical protein
MIVMLVGMTLHILQTAASLQYLQHRMQTFALKAAPTNYYNQIHITRYEF